MENDEVEVSVSLNYRTDSSIGENTFDSRNYILSMVAQISGVADWGPNAPPDSEIVLGELHFYLIRVGNAVNDGARIFDVFDTFQETHDAGCAIYRPSFREFLPAVQRRYDSAYPSNDIMLLHYLTIEPFARGQRLGLAVLERAIRDWSSGCALVLMKPFPLQFEAAENKKERNKRLGLDGFSNSEGVAFRKLRSYYEQLGFERLSRSRYYALCPDEVHPTAKSLGLTNCVNVPRNVAEEARTLRLV